MTFTEHNAAGGPGIPAPYRRSVSLGSDPGALITAMPALLGFRPTGSIILVGLSGGGPGSDAVGPVVRFDLSSEAVAAGARAMGRANYDRPGASVAVIVVGPGTWPLPGGITGILEETRRRLGGFAVGFNGVFVTPAIADGQPWRRIEQDGRGARWLCAESGVLGDPADNPAWEVTEDPDAPVPSPEEFNRVLDMEDEALTAAGDPGLLARLPRSWFTGEGPPAGSGYGDIVAMCRLVRDIDHVVAADGDRDSMVSAARGEVRRRLLSEGLGAELFAMCIDERLFPALVTLGMRRESATVEGLLLEVAVLARSALRHRALALIAVMGVCGRGGVLGFQAARRCLGEMGDGAHGRGSPSDTVVDRITGGIAEIIVVGMCGGAGSELARKFLDEGLRLVDGAARAAEHENPAGAGLIRAAVDRGAVSEVRNALSHRAVT
ncbi:MAG: DUF4192 family protein [Mycobacteriaceae bacterium]|uniref:DUF4192 family protein n=1 Tax=Corynebacterium sp. TaxID=1720 RepID=UPI003F9544F7